MEQLGFFIFMDQQEKEEQEQQADNYRSEEFNIIVGTDEPHQDTI